MKNKINGLIYEMVFIEHSESYCGYLLVPSCWSELIETKVSQPHGGITYSQIQPTKAKEWISWTLLGFDCNHFGDAGRGATKKNGYRTSKYVKKELKKWSREIMWQLKKEILKDFKKKEIRLLKKLIDLKREFGVKFKNCLIGHGDDLTPNKEKPELLENGISVIGRSTIIPEGAVVERNVRICTRAKIDDKNKLIKSGETLRR